MAVGCQVVSKTWVVSLPYWVYGGAVKEPAADFTGDRVPLEQIRIAVTIGILAADEMSSGVADLREVAVAGQDFGVG